MFLFDEERKLRYWGRVNDSRFEDPKTVTSHDARNAIVELLAGKPVTKPKTIATGCSTKWAYKRGAIAKAKAKMEYEPVNLNEIDVAGVAELAKNYSDRLRLINIWATWCAPCIAEFPALVSLAYRFGGRPYEMITISMDNPKMKAQAKIFLENQHVMPHRKLKKKLDKEGRETLNFIYTWASTDALRNALDTEWLGPLPFTVVIAPGGKIVYRHNGPIDHDELKIKLLELLGEYYDTPSFGKL